VTKETSLQRDLATMKPGTVAMLRQNAFRPPKRGPTYVRPHKTKLDALTGPDHDQLIKWLCSAQSYQETCDKIWERFHIKIRRDKLCRYYRENVLGFVIERRRKSVDLALGYNEEIDRKPGKFTKAAMDALEQRAMQVTLDPNVSPKEIKIFLELVLRFQEKKIREDQILLKLRRLEMLEKKQKKLEVVFNSRLTPQEVADRCRIIFKQNGSTNINSRQTEERAPAAPAGLDGPADITS